MTEKDSYTVSGDDLVDTVLELIYQKNCCQSAKWDTFNTEDFVMIRRH